MHIYCQQTGINRQNKHKGDMTMKITRRTQLLVVALVLCMTTMIGSTLAWFTDSVSVTGNKIESGTLELEVLYQDDNNEWKDIEKNPTPLFNYTLWEPGYAVVKGIEIKNAGTLALKYKLNFELTSERTGDYKLEDVIDVYLFTEKPTDRTAFVDDAKVGTLADLIYGEDADGTVHGNLAGKATTGPLYIGLKMQEAAGNEYQKLTVGKGFNLVVVATQDTVEFDSFNNEYDKDATYPVFMSKSYVRKLNIAHTQTSYISISTGSDFLPIMAAMPEITGYSLFDNGTRITDSVTFSFTDVTKQDINADSYKVSFNLAILDDKGNDLELKAGMPSTINGKEYLHMFINLIELPEGYAVSGVTVNGTALIETQSGNPVTGEYWIGYEGKDVYLQSTTAGLIEITVAKTN